MTERLVDALRPIRFRGKGRLLDRWVPRSGTRDVTVFGSRMRLNLADVGQRQVFLGVYERRETNWICRTLPPGGTFVDVGANVGYFTALAASLVGPKGRVLAVEPCTRAADQLEHMVAHNALGSVVVERCALGSQVGEAALPVLPLESRNLTPSLLESSSVTEMVRLDTLDHLLQVHRVSSVDVLKIDVEGYEPRVLAGGAEVLGSGRVRALVCEFNEVWLSRGGSSPRALYDQITRLGFRDRWGPPRFRPGCIEGRAFVWSAHG